MRAKTAPRCAAALLPRGQYQRTRKICYAWADVQRRAGLLAEAGATLDLVPLSDDSFGRIVAFERERIAMGDTGRQMLSSALRPPARTPHVSHSKSATGSFWERLVGRSMR